MNRYFLSMAVSCLALSSGIVYAQTTEMSVGSSTSEAQVVSPAVSAWTFNIKANFDGPTVAQPDGRSGDGSVLNLKNSFRFGRSLGDGFAVEAVPVLQYKSSNPGRREMFELTDPYLAGKKADMFGTKKRGFDIAGEVRYYVPVSKETKREIGTSKDKGNGRILLRGIYTQQIPSAPLEVVSDWNYYHHLAEAPTAKGLSGVFELYNFLNWKVHPSFTPYVSYKNFVNRYQDASLDAWSKSHTVGVGGKWQAMRELSIDPAFDVPFNIDDTQFRVEAIYRFI